jgi:hypothetical protein
LPGSIGRCWKGAGPADACQEQKPDQRVGSSGYSGNPCLRADASADRTTALSAGPDPRAFDFHLFVVYFRLLFEMQINV